MPQNLIINGVIYNGVPEIRVPRVGGGDAVYMDISPSDITAADVLSGKNFVNQYGAAVGSMPSVGAQIEEITTRDMTVALQQGFHNGSGSVGISTAEKAKLISANIKAGVTVLGVTGASEIIDTTISANPANESTILRGRQAYVNGRLITGSMDTPGISQDSVTGVLTVQ